jgi:membrane protein implicated in regulation of membrane protease activity
VTTDLELLLRLFGTIGCATALALARVFAFAAVVTGFATTLALAGVLTLASVLFLGLLVVLLVLSLVLALILRAQRSLKRGKQSRGLDCRTGPGEQSRERRTSQQSFCRLRHFAILQSIGMSYEALSRRSLRLAALESRWV